MKKSLLVISLILTLLTTFSKSYDVRSTEKLSYIIAIGIDKSASGEEPLQLTIQIAKPDTAEPGGTKIKTDILTVTCNSINIGLAMLNLLNVHELNLSHCTAIIISEDLAKENIGNLINTLSNNIEIRPTCNVLVCKDTAYEFLEKTSKIEDISSKFYTSFISSAKNISYVTPCELFDFYSALNGDVKEPIALYSYIKEDTIESIGLAVFKDNKMVGRTSRIRYNLL